MPPQPSPPNVDAFVRLHVAYEPLPTPDVACIIQSMPPPTPPIADVRCTTCCLLQSAPSMSLTSALSWHDHSSVTVTTDVRIEEAAFATVM
ncbi:hypothetical protein ACLOJK_018936 [Asimina triloba]